MTIKETQIPDSQDQSNAPILVYRANWVCPVDQAPIANGAVVVDEHEILSVGTFSNASDFVSAANSRLVDLGNGAIVPGLVNAHTHLEFSDLTRPLGKPGINFTDWIRLIVSRRNESNQESCSNGLTGKKTAAIKLGVDESFEAGVWAIGEIATSPFQLNDYRNRRKDMMLVCFLEQLGRDELILDQKRKELSRFFSQSTDAGAWAERFGSSPHAPYSVGPDLLLQTIQQSRSSLRPVAMHLAETLIERELIERQTGGFVSLLREFGVWDRDAFEKGLSIYETLQVLADAHLSLIVHGNYLSDVELDFVAANSKQMSIAYCPRTHRYFDHSVYPLEKMLKRDINVCLGTDSRASNPDLDLFKEAKHVAGAFSSMDPQIILQMATLNGAAALGIAQSYGSIAVGKRPALSFVKHPDSGLGDSPFDWLFDQASICAPLFNQT